jgi:glycosyltransferase involved in cell wall biosynthesis
MRVVYLLDDTALFGGVKVVLQHAELLRRQGFEAMVAARAAAPSWYPVTVPFFQVDSFVPAEVPEADVVVATYWTTLEAALELGFGQVVHLCQGFEGFLVHNRSDHPAIERVYRRPVPAITVSPHLAQLIADRFQRPARVVSPPLEPFWRPRLRLGPRRRARVIVTNPFENVMKGVETALLAVNELRRRGRQVCLVRLSQWPLTEQERRVIEPDEFHHHLAPTEVPGLLRSCDLLLAPSWEQEGFGLAVLEAMACGLPVIASAIPSFEWFAAPAAALVPPKDSSAMAEEIDAVLGDTRRWRHMRRAGLTVARDFAEPIIAERLSRAIQWAASGEWRQDQESLCRT